MMVTNVSSARSVTGEPKSRAGLRSPHCRQGASVGCRQMVGRIHGGEADGTTAARPRSPHLCPLQHLESRVPRAGEPDVQGAREAQEAGRGGADLHGLQVLLAAHQVQDRAGSAAN